jgi:N1-aminopropylagmatine ureohydrolase
METDATYPNFGGVPSVSGGDPAASRTVFVQAPYEGSVSYGGGTAQGPSAILEASRQVETRDDETGVDLEELSYALGPVVESAPDEDPAAYSGRLQAAVRGVVSADVVPFTLGGEHSVTIGAVRAIREVHPKAHLLVIDAHADLRDRFHGSDHSHACVTRRLLEGGTATVIGVRSYSVAEASFAAGNRDVRLVSGREASDPAFDVPAFVASLPPVLYLSFDVDGLDPSIVSATGTPEPGGLGWWRALAIVREAFARRSIVGMDVVELAPGGDSRASEFATARLVAKMLSYQALADRARA